VLQDGSLKRAKNKKQGMRYGGSLRLTGALSAKIENNTISLSGKYSM